MEKDVEGQREGKSISSRSGFSDMGQFYVLHLFLAESKKKKEEEEEEEGGKIKVAPERQPRASGADHVFFFTNGKKK